ncbi:hypothetical protein LNKW23_24640 [Paralimibaculum aggregatum]|uniref:Uncharacterized protein n=1 Tax=Paralimibaculum aggregatum TaxID=3036245 RepID=A0ABQ6LIZ2_9RHOB|nr:hypothetical protein [Limibaculum sp. NKW23]GMG83251.1 hypothetical protein LNKW23_24640 [Limibaculum sp. NKW23]
MAHRAFRAGAALALAGLLSACAATSPDPAPVAAPEPAAPPAAPPAARPAFDVQPPLLGPVLAPQSLPAPASITRERVERLAVACWLDDELAAEIMLVDRRTGDIVAAGETGELLRIGFAAAGPLETAVQLSGPALADAGRAGRMSRALANALEGERPAC